MLKKKIKNKQSGILLYGLTPPKEEYSKERIRQIAQKQIERINNLEVDGVILYDIQDESARTTQKRPFPFMQTIEPSFYANEFLHADKPKIIYKAIGKHKKEEIVKWLKDERLEFCVFVGVASKKQELKISLEEAYKIKKEINADIPLGGIAIPERHRVKKDEQKRILSKIDNGCEFFVTQAVYDKEVAKEFLDDYILYMKKKNIPFVPIIFTFTPCGSLKTLNFMKWLGISVSNEFEEELKTSSDILDKSIKLCLENFRYLYEYGLKNGVPIGCNVESVAVRKEEIEASIKLLTQIKKILK